MGGKSYFAWYPGFFGLESENHGFDQEAGAVEYLQPRLISPVVDRHVEKYAKKTHQYLS
jgi:hypothetical protein